MAAATDGIAVRLRGIAALIVTILCIFAVAAAQHGKSVSGEKHDAAAAETRTVSLLADEVRALARPQSRALAFWHTVPLLLRPENVVEEFDVSKNGDFLVVPVTICEKKYDFAVDTGCTVCIADVHLRRLLAETGRTAAMNGEPGFEVFELRDAFVGKSRLPVEGETLCMNLSAFRDRTGHDVYGLLGMTFLKRHVLHVDFDAGKLFILRSGPPSEDGAIELKYSRGVPTLETEVSPGVTLPFEIDTGACGSTVHLTRSTYDNFFGQGRLRVQAGLGRALGLLGEEERRGATLDRLQVAGIEHRGMAVESGSGRTNSLGLAYLSRFALTFDFPNDLVYMREGRRFFDRDVFDLSGAEICRRGGEMKISRVYNGSPAADAALRPGDRILQVDGASATELSVFELRRIFSEPGARVRLVVQNDDEPREAELVLAD